MTEHNVWHLHVCALSKDCRRVGAPWRVHVNSPWLHVAVALRPQDKFAHRINQRASWFHVVRTPR